MFPALAIGKLGTCLLAKAAWGDRGQNCSKSAYRNESLDTIKIKSGSLRDQLDPP